MNATNDCKLRPIIVYFNHTKVRLNRLNDSIPANSPFGRRERNGSKMIFKGYSIYSTVWELVRSN
jgi:hypothetical protein